MTRSTVTTPGGEIAAAAGLASAAGVARAGAQEVAPDSMTAAAAHVTGTAAEWDLVGKDLINLDNKKAPSCLTGLFYQILCPVFCY